MNADALRLPKDIPPPLPSFGDRLSRAVEAAAPNLDAGELARIRVAMVELVRREKCSAWDAGAEFNDRAWYAAYYGETYWGFVASKDNPHRRQDDTDGTV